VVALHHDAPDRHGRLAGQEAYSRLEQLCPNVLPLPWPWGHKDLNDVVRAVGFEQTRRWWVQAVRDA
jgi:hypothetical protein